MKVYKFIFIVGFLNPIVPFFGVPSVYKNYAIITLAVVTIGYALIVRAVEKERENNMHVRREAAAMREQAVAEAPVQSKTIEDVVEMVEKKERPIVSDVVPKRRGRKPKIMVREETYE